MRQSSHNQEPQSRIKPGKLLYLLALLSIAALALLAAGRGRATARSADITGTPSFLPLIFQAPATATPPPNGADGIQTLLFRMHQTTGAVNEDMFFDFKVVNTAATPITYGILAAHTDQGVTADSWHDPLLPGQPLAWTDHINFPNAGTYQVYLGICFSSHDACKTGGAPWTRLSDYVTVVIHTVGTPSFLPLISNGAATPTRIPSWTPPTVAPTPAP